MIHAIYREDEIILAVNGIPYVFDVDHPKYDAILEAVEEDDEESLLELISNKSKLGGINNELSAAGIMYVNGEYTYNDQPIPMDLSEYMLDAVNQRSVTPIINFIKKLFENPNYDTRQHLFQFMDKNKMPIDSSGNFLAYKVVRSDYMDKHSGSIRNKPGDKPRVSWSQVDTNPDVLCSKGLHCCSYSYLQPFFSTGDRVVSVSVDPQDVGSIPTDYDGAKMRTRGYTVVADITDRYHNEHEAKLHAEEDGLDPHRPASCHHRIREYF